LIEKAPFSKQENFHWNMAKDERIGTQNITNWRKDNYFQSRSTKNTPALAFIYLWHNRWNHGSKFDKIKWRS
jgi:hypothetical protein